ncbi:hypothetical protein ACFU93_37000 [Streptomyces sp. NPDC057611]|uniref:hypothetical protein n=1 Tax=Streptomyces sp. NPDC057611 TaxID=3346182 RepID=UPI0036B7376B
MSGSDLSAPESAAALLAVVRAVQDSESEPTADELAVLLGPVTDALEGVIGVAVRCMDTPVPPVDRGGAAR